MSDARSVTEGSNGRQATAAAPARASEDSIARERRVAELRERYRKGTYRVNSNELSKSIIDKHLIR